MSPGEVVASVACVCVSGLVAWRMYLGHVVDLHDSRLKAAEAKRAVDDAAAAALVLDVKALTEKVREIQAQTAYGRR